MNRHLKLSALLLAMFATLPAISSAEDKVTLYTLSNDLTGNAVYVYNRLPNGDIQHVNHYATGGEGSGAGLGNQGALAISANERYLFAINAGSNEVSVFEIQSNGLKLLDHAAETGKTPVSIAVHDNLVYVVNSGDDSIFGFKFDPATNKLMPLPTSYMTLSGTATGAAQISFNSTGDALVVSEKASNKLTSFHLTDKGIPSTKYSLNSAGMTPFGFAFGKRDQLFVSEAQGGPTNLNASSISSYAVNPDGSLKLITGEVASLQTAACWLATTPDGRMAFTADTPSSAISSYTINFNGRPTLKQSLAATENKPIDLAVSPDGQTLFSLNSGNHTLSSYRIMANGMLKKLKMATALPDFATGLLVR
jgi:6-phosphogluconolactonase (cycloisomerase 2 family)